MIVEEPKENKNVEAVSNEQVAVVGEYEKTRLSNLFDDVHFLMTTSTVPTDTPVRAIDKFRLYKSGSVVRLYVWDIINSAWQSFSSIPVRYNAGNSSTALTVNFNNGGAQFVTLTGNCTFTFSNPVEGGRYIIELLQDGTGSRLVTWPSTVKWPGGVAPTLTTTASRTDIITLYYNGTNYAGAYTLNYIL